MKEKNKKSYIYSILTFFILFFLTYYFVLRDYDFGEMISSFDLLNGSYLCLATLAVVIHTLAACLFMINTFRYFNKKIGFFKELGYRSTEVYYSGVTPSALGGQPAEMMEMAKDGIPYRMSSVVVLLNSTMYMATIVVFGLFGFIFHSKLLFSQDHMFIIAMLLGFFGTIFVVMMFLLLLFSKGFINLLSKLIIKIVRLFKLKKLGNRWETKLNETVADYHKIATFALNHPKMLIENFIILMVERLAIVSIPYIVMRGFGLNHYSFGEVISLQVATSLGSDFFPLPGGVGISEVLTLQYNRMIFGEGLMVPGMMLIRFFSFYGLMIFSLVTYMIFKFIKRKPVKDIEVKDEK